jgi:hypothetical protein
VIDGWLAGGCGTSWGGRADLQGGECAGRQEVGKAKKMTGVGNLDYKMCEGPLRAKQIVLGFLEFF